MTDALSQLIEWLSSPPSAIEMAEGWETESKTAIRNYFQRATNGSIKADAGLVRGLDAWGISSGKLYHECLNVNLTLTDPIGRPRRN